MSSSAPDFSTIALAILAAGQSARFGAADKLAADLGGRMLGTVIADRLAGLGWHSASVVAASPDHPCAAHWREAGYRVLVNPQAASGMGSSVACAAREAAAKGAEALLICLADMPCVSLRHIRALASTGAEATSITASSDGTRPMPPALFGSAHFPALASLQGDSGARELIANAPTITAPAGELIDIDQPRDLAQAEEILAKAIRRM